MFPSEVRIGFPFKIKLISVLVPPMSIVIRFLNPVNRPMKVEATTPPAGPESTV